MTGRWHGGMLEVEGDEDSEVFLLSMGSMAAEMGIAAQNLREQGLKVANVRIRVYRPFPTEALRQLLPANAK